MKADLSPPLRHTIRSPPFIHIHTKAKPAGGFSLQATIMTNSANDECVFIYMWGFITHKYALTLLLSQRTPVIFLIQMLNTVSHLEFPQAYSVCIRGVCISCLHILNKRHRNTSYRKVVLSPDFWTGLLKTKGHCKKTMFKQNESKITTQMFMTIPQNP